MATTRWQRIRDALQTDLEGSKVLLNMDDGTYYDLQGVGGAIWDLLEKPRTQEEIVDQITKDFDAPKEKVASDVQAFLSDLKAHGLVETT